MGPVDAYGTIFGAALVFGAMSLGVQIFRRRLAQPPSLGMRDAYVRSWRGLRREVITPEYLATVGLTLAIAPLAVSAFSAAKQAIPILHPFTWDTWIAKADLPSPAGKPLAQRLQPMLGHPLVTQWLDWFYHHVWTMLLLAAFTISVLSPPSPDRRRFLLSFILVCLIVGNVLALAWSSAGPAYYSFVVVGSHNPYASLLAYLRTVDTKSPLLSVEGQRVLWSVYRERTTGFGYGVSAMPSTHVASAVLVALFGIYQSRLLGVVLSAAAVLTFVCSVSLGWHYPLDGYVGIVVTLIIWWVAGYATRGQSGRLAEFFQSGGPSYHCGDLIGGRGFRDRRLATLSMAAVFAAGLGDIEFAFSLQ